MENRKIAFETNSFDKRLKSMLRVDFRRMFKTSFFYIMVGICLVIPILILVMTSMMGDTTIDHVTGEVVLIETFTNTWQAIGSYSGEEMSMGLTSMCNINMLYFLIAVLACVFVSEDFKSGYSKNLFTVRANKTDYVISKIIVCFIGGICMLLAYFIGAMLGGAIAGLPFDTGVAGFGGIFMCMLSKLLLVAVFVPIYIAVSVSAKQRTWLSICASLAVGMLLFMMIPALTPLDATFMNVILCFAGGALFSLGLGAVSKIVLEKTSLV